MVSVPFGVQDEMEVGNIARYIFFKKNKKAKPGMQFSSVSCSVVVQLDLAVLDCAETNYLLK